MNTHQLCIKLRSSYPNIWCLRKGLAKARIRLLKRRLLPDELVKKAECDPDLKRRLVSEYSQKWKKYLKADRAKANKLFVSDGGTVDQASVTDAIFCRLAYGFSMTEYLPFQLREKTYEERKEFISDIDRYCFVYQMNDISDLQLFNDKVKTYEKLHDFYKRACVAIEKPSDLSSFLSFVQQHPVFIKKSAVESLGRSVELVDIQSLDQTPEQYFHSLIKRGKHILEEKVEMGKELAGISASVNTVRCIALKTRHGVVTPYCMMRFGRNGSIVDNAGAGGLIAGINMKTGIIETNGFDRQYEEFETHPDSGVRFKGIQLPEWETMLDIVKKMSGQFDTIHYIGWDMAYSDKGWLVIEGNSMSQIIGPQFLRHQGIKKEILGYMSDMELYF